MLHTMALKSSQTGFLVAVSLLVLSCGKAKSLSELSIYGGQSVPAAQHLNVVALTDTDGIYCTGTALTPTLVVTAAHCILDEEDQSAIKIYAGTGQEGGMVEGQYPVLRLEASPRYHSYNSGSAFDVAYVLLAKPLELPATAYVKILTDESEIKELLVPGTPSTLVGFGARNKNGFGMKYEVTAPVRKVSANEVEIGGEGRDACQGDSGGPAFGMLKSGAWRMYGVVSRGGDCGTGGTWSLLHKNICWIQKASAVDLNLPTDFCR